jgi:hypothetical protein
MYNEMGGRTERLRNSYMREDGSHGFSRWAGNESEGDSESCIRSKIFSRVRLCL